MTAVPPPARSEASADSPGVRLLVLMALLVAGIAMWLQFGSIERPYDFQKWALVGAAVLALAGMAPGVGAWLTRLRRPRPWTRRLIALGVFLGSLTAFWYFNFVREASDIYPSVCDEYSYLIQSQLLLHGRLWSAPHPHSDFFTTFQLIAEPVYGSIYFPGTALWVAPWSMLDPAGGWAFVGPMLAAALAVMLVYLITSELLDNLAGLLAAFITMSVPIWRGLALVIMGQCIAAMLGLLVIWLFLRWRQAARADRKGLSLAWGAAAAFVATWAVLSRPVDGLAYALPVVIGVIFSRSVSPRLRAASLAAAVVGMVPMAALQLSFNQAVTGELLRTQFSWYNDKYLPGTSYGAPERDIDRRPPQATAHFHVSFQNFTRPFVVEMRDMPLGDLAHERFRMTSVTAATNGMMLVWVPFALLILLPRRGLPLLAPGSASQEEVSAPEPERVGGWDLALLAAPYPLMVLLYLPYAFYLYQYAGAAVPSVAFLQVAGAYGMVAFAGRISAAELSAGSWTGRAARAAGIAALVVGAGLAVSLATGISLHHSVPWLVTGPLALLFAGVWIWQRWAVRIQQGLYVFALGGLLALATEGVPGLHATASEDWYRVPELRQVDEIMEGLDGPAVAFITPPGIDAPPEAEAVYNLGVTHPDLARVVRAHDLGRRNVELLAYYAEHDPDRRVYHYQRRTRTVTDLGTAGALAARPEEELVLLFDELSLPWRRRYAAILVGYGYDPSEFPFVAPDPATWDQFAESEPAAPEGYPQVHHTP